MFARSFRIKSEEAQWLADCYLIEPFTHKDDIMVGKLKTLDEVEIEPEDPVYEVLKQTTLHILDKRRQNGSLSLDNSVDSSPQ
jgi:hypothetical protein